MDAIRRRPADHVAARKGSVDVGCGPEGVPIPGSAASSWRLGIPARRQRGGDHVVVERFQPDSRGLGAGHQRADDVMRRAERDALAHEGVGDRRRGGEALVGCHAHALAIDGQRVEHPGEHAEARLEDADRPEQRRLVLLQVPLIARAGGP